MDNARKTMSEGSKVFGSDGGHVGTIKAVHEDHIVVTEGTLIKHDLYIPIDHVGMDSDGRVTVSVKASEADKEGWRYPPSAGFEHKKPAYPEVPETTTMQAAGYSAGRLSAPEPQGALKDDGMIDQDEVPGEDMSANDTPDALDDND